MCLIKRNHQWIAEGLALSHQHADKFMATKENNSFQCKQTSNIFGTCIVSFLAILWRFFVHQNKLKGVWDTHCDFFIVPQDLQF